MIKIKCFKKYIKAEKKRKKKKAVKNMNQTSAVVDKRGLTGISQPTFVLWSASSTRQQTQNSTFQRFDFFFSIIFFSLSLFCLSPSLSLFFSFLKMDFFPGCQKSCAVPDKKIWRVKLWSRS